MKHSRTLDQIQKTQEPFKATRSLKIEVKTNAISRFCNKFFFATAGEETHNYVKQRHQTEGFDVQARHHGRIHRTDYEKVVVVESPTSTSGRCNISYIAKSTWHDQINLQHLEESLIVAFPYIALIINTSIVTKVIPKPWKRSILIPIPKIRWYWRTNKFQTD